MFEILLLEDLATATFCVKSLEKPDPGRIEVEQLGPFNANCTIISAASEIQNKSMLHIPRSKTFPAVDGVQVVPNKRLVIYVQSTVSPKHPIKLNPLEKVYNILMDQNQFQGYTHMFLFIVPKDIFDDFTFQPYMNADGKQVRTRIGIDMKQYVGTVNSSVPEALSSQVLTQISDK